MTKPLEIVQRDRVRIIRLNRPEKMNALSDELAWGIVAAVNEAAADDGTWVVGLTGTGPAFCAGAGLALALASDIRLMARSARLIAGYPRIGGSPDGGMSWTLAQLVGYEQAMRFLLENRTVLGEEAKELGLVGEVVDDDQFDERFLDYLAQLTNLSPITSRSTKRVVRAATAHPDLEGHLRYEVHNIRRAFANADGQEARQALLDKRDPVFEGR